MSLDTQTIGIRVAAVELIIKTQPNITTDDLIIQADKLTQFVLFGPPGSQKDKPKLTVI